MLTPMLYRLIGGLVFLAAVFISGLITGREQLQDKWDAAKAVQTKAVLVAEQEFRAREQSMQQKYNEAINAATERENKIRADYAAVHASSLGLRDTIAALRGQLSATTPETCRITADAALAVFGECANRLGEVAELADRHASDAETCRAAWPE